MTEIKGTGHGDNRYIAPNGVDAQARNIADALTALTCSQSQRITRLETIIANMLEIPTIKYFGMPTPPLSEE